MQVLKKIPINEPRFITNYHENKVILDGNCKWHFITANSTIEYGNKGNGDGQFLDPRAVCSIYVTSSICIADTGNDRVQVLSSKGTLKFSIGKKGSENGEFLSPSAVFADEVNLYVVDSGNNRIQVFTFDGKFLYKFGTAGNGDGQFNNPTGICKSGSEYLYVVDSGNYRIQVFSITGKYVKSFGSKVEFAAPPIAIHSNRKGFLWIVDGNCVQQFDTNGKLCWKYKGQMQNPVSIKMTMNNHVLVADRKANCVYELELVQYQ